MWINFQLPLNSRSLVKMQNPNEDTEWNDVLRKKGIIPEKPKEKEITEDELVQMVEQTLKEKSGSKNFEKNNNFRIWWV